MLFEMKSSYDTCSCARLYTQAGYWLFGWQVRATHLGKPLSFSHLAFRSLAERAKLPDLDLQGCRTVHGFFLTLQVWIDMQSFLGKVDN